MAPTAVRQRPAAAEARRRGRRREGERRRARRDVTLGDRYSLAEGRVFVTGVQAIVRVPLDHHRMDARGGLHTATLISGYQGSPLGGLDLELQRQSEICTAHHVFHRPAVNEELGATSAWGSQLAGGLPDSRYDGVVGIWYGKAPGLDRAGDALRHGNYVGVSRTGGAMAVVGDDPSCKSSTLPSASEAALADMHMPVFSPGSVQEVLDLGRHALACSRASGLWSGFKVVTSVADAAATAEVGLDRVEPVTPEVEWMGRPYRHVPSAELLAPASLDMERTLLGPRTELALAYARENRVNRVEGARDAWLGIAAAGKSYHDLRQALADLGLSDRELDRAGVRILRLGMIWPLEPQAVGSFARGLDEIVVVEEKRAFIEAQLKEALYGTAASPRIVGKRDEQGAPLLAADSDLDADAIARAVAARLGRRTSIESVEARIRVLDERRRGPIALPMNGGPTTKRTPFFCSGCPHNSSTPAPDGTLVGGGIGCHTMILLNPEGRGEITGVTQMGGEGAQWIGMAPFCDRDHFVQNLGDGTFHHSGSLAVRASVAAGVNVTYKLLYNDAVAMTGGQRVEGALAVPELTRLLELEGVRRIIVTTEDPARYRGVELAAIAEVRDRSELMEAQEELATVDGVTVLIHDQECAAELRRKRRRGRAPEPQERIHINERVCEGCGDCGRKSSCLSVVPVETEFGRKTQIHQSSCNKDYSCVEGDCPSFVTVVPGRRSKPGPPAPPHGLPEPRPLVSAEDFTMRMVGIGGTGVVTASQVVGMAALIDGLHVAGLDQTGLSQKGGPVTSDLRLSRDPIAGVGRVSAASCDLLLGFDLLGAATPSNLAVAHPERTVAVVSTSTVPTGRMVVDAAERFPRLSAQLDAIDRSTRGADNVQLDAQALSERLFDDHMPANMVALGAAYQRGALPVSKDAIEQAIRLNGAAVNVNLSAFEWGRACVAAPDAVAEATRPAADRTPPAPELDGALGDLVDEVAAGDDELRRLLSLRAAELVAYQSRALAERYLRFVEEVREREGERLPGRLEMTRAFAAGLFKLMAYKDEYEVARLHLDAAERGRLREEFGEDARIWFNLHPPLLRALGLNRKLKLGAWFTPALRGLRMMRRLRGTPLDVFGHTRVRRTERCLPDEYRALVDEALSLVDPDSYELAVELCELPDAIRGYEEIKMESVDRYHERAAALLGRIRAPARAPL